MTIDFDFLARRRGYEDCRQLISINYYYSEESLKWLAEYLLVSEPALLEYMDRERFPRRGRGQPAKHGFYCEECFRLTALRDMRHNRDQTKYVCVKCSQKEWMEKSEADEKGGDEKSEDIDTSKVDISKNDENSQS